MKKKKLCSLTDTDTKHPDIGFEYFPSFTFLCPQILFNGCGQIKMNYCCRSYSLVFSSSCVLLKKEAYTLFLSLFSVLVVHFLLANFNSQFCIFQHWWFLLNCWPECVQQKNKDQLTKLEFKKGPKWYLSFRIKRQQLYTKLICDCLQIVQWTMPTKRQIENIYTSSEATGNKKNTLAQKLRDGDREWERLMCQKVA